MNILRLTPGRYTSKLSATFRRLAGSAFVDLDFNHAEHAPNRGALSTLLVAHAAVVTGFALLELGQSAQHLILGWASLALLASLVPAMVIAMQNRMPRSKFGQAQLTEVWATLIGLSWAALPALFFDIVTPEVRVLVVGLTFAMAGVGTLALAAVPKAAVIFCVMIIASLTLSSIKLGGAAGLALGVFSFLYGMAATAMILRGHDAAVHRTRIECEVKKQNEIIGLLLNDFSESRSDWLWETGRDGRITYASRGLAASMAVNPSSLVGAAFDSIVPAGGDTPGWHEFQTAMLRRKPVTDLDVGIPFPSGHTCWRMTARPVFSEAGEFQGYRGVAHDVTDDQHATQALAAAKEAAERSSAKKSQFLAVMSHELRTPLNAIVGFAELLGSPQAEALGEDSRAEHLRTILDSSRHLQSLISDILDASRIEKGTMTLAEQETDAAELVEVAVKMCRDAAERTDATVIARIVDGVELRCDITRIKQVLINLITNALKFSPAGGYVNVGFERLKSDGLAIYVRDSGVGIARTDLERIFEPYVQADEGTARRFGGAGHGLAIARRIAMLHGGNVTIESEPGVGTTARLVLPSERVIWPEPEAAAASRAA